MTTVHVAVHPNRRPLSGEDFPLHAAVRNRNLDDVRKLLQNDLDCDVNQRDSSNCTPLMVAVAGGPGQCFQDLLEFPKSNKPSKPNLQYLEEEDWWINGVSLVRILLQRGASAVARDKCGRTPLHMASEAESVDVVCLLVEAGADVHARDVEGQTPLHEASSNKWYGERIARFLLERGLDPYQIDKKGWTAVENAVVSSSGTPDLIKVYTDQFGINLSDSRLVFDSGTNLVHHLVESPDFEKEESLVLRLQLLLTQGLSVNSQTHNGLTPLHHAMISGGDDKTIQILCNLNADPTIADKCRRSPLHNFHFRAISCCGDDLFDEQHLKKESLQKIHSTIQTLKTYGMDLNAQDIFGATALHYAIIGILKYEEYIKILLDNGANLFIKDKTGVCSLHLAASLLDTQSLAMIVQYCTTSDLNTTDSYGATVLHFTVAENNAEGTEVFLMAGADPHLRDSQGYTAYDLAVKMAHTDIINIFQSWAADKGVILTSKFPLSPMNFLAIPPTLTPKEIELGADLTEAINPCILQNLHLCCTEILHSIEIGPASNNPDTALINDEINKFIERLARLCAEKNLIFSFQPELRGSAREGTKCGDPDEYDVLCTLEAFTGVGDVSLDKSPPGFAQLKLKSPKDCAFLQSMPWLMTEDENLNISLVAVGFYRAIKEVLNDRAIWQDTPLVYYKDVVLKSASCTFDLRWNGRISKTLVISIDLVPGIKLPGYWPSVVTRDFPATTHLDKYPCYLLCGFITDDKYQRRTCRKYSYKISYTAVELAIMLEVPYYVRLGYTLSKALRSPYFCPRIVIRDMVDTTDTRDDEYQPDVKKAHLTEQSQMGGAQKTFPKPLSDLHGEKDADENTGSDDDDDDNDDRESDAESQTCDPSDGEHVKASDVITSFMLKNALMWEIHRAGAEGLQSRPATDIDGAILWARRIYRHLYTALKEDKMPYFFVQSMDLLDTSGQDYDKQRDDADEWKSEAMRSMYKRCPNFLDEPLEYSNDIDTEEPDIKTADELKNPRPFVNLINKLLGNID